MPFGAFCGAIIADEHLHKFTIVTMQLELQWRPMYDLVYSMDLE